MNNISFEFFPPNTPEGTVKLRAVTQELGALAPEFFSVTYGAGGSTREKTLSTVLEIIDAGFAAAPHLSCIGQTRESIRERLASYTAAGIKRLVALRGDLPSGYGLGGEFRYASDLVAFVRSETGRQFHIEVAAYPETHPQARSPLADLDAFVAKVEAGADSGITQYFFNPDAYFRFVEDARAIGITIPIVPGIMPISNFTQLKRFSDACGAEIPRWIEKRMRGYGDDVDAVRQLGADVVANLCRRLAEGGAPGFHFYTLNRAKATTAVLERLR